MLNHTALLNKRRAEWKIGGFNVHIEGQNSFQLRGKSATLAGKPDLITQREDGSGAVIIDAKTGQESPPPLTPTFNFIRPLHQFGPPYSRPTQLPPTRQDNRIFETSPRRK